MTMFCHSYIQIPEINAFLSFVIFLLINMTGCEYSEKKNFFYNT